ncbi:MAG: hypothetical protein HYV29_02255 [Ignavibacteriales bacterium]|nr:hypothetical protein [Ignavibacteriales bacterium]
MNSVFKKIVLLLLTSVGLFAQQKQIIRCSVSYVAASVIYFDAGRENGIAAGDTLNVERNGSVIGKVVITAVSKRSSAAQIISQVQSISVGDAGSIEKILPETISSAAIDTLKSATAAPIQTPVQMKKSESPATENIISGRVGLQYSGVTTNDSRFNLSQPSVVFRMDVQRLFGTAMAVTMYSRNYYDLSQNYSRYGGATRLKNRLYEFVLHHDDPASAFGYGMGRMTSRYVGGLGTFDGGQFFYQAGNVTTGVMVGAKVDDLSYEVNSNDNKGALFVNYQYNSEFVKHYDGTFAYGQQLAKGKLDREFIYLQNFLSLGSDLSIYESTELELNDIDNGIRKRSFTLSNTYLSVNYYPYSWLSGNVGYDGSRSVYLFESMKSIPDTLFDKHLMQGYRAGATVRLPYFISLSGNLSYRTKKGDARDARTLSGTVRSADLFGTEIGASVRYADIVGVYSDGTNVTVDLDRTFFYRLSLTVRYDYYSYTILSNASSYITHTYTVSGNYRITKMLYAALNADRVNDSMMNSYRLFVEMGIRF